MADKVYRRCNVAFAALDSDLAVDLKRYNQRRAHRREVASWHEYGWVDPDISWKEVCGRAMQGGNC